MINDFTPEQIESCERVANLIAKSYRKTITREEKEELDEWVGGNPKVREPIHRELTNRRKIKKALKLLNW
jgi:hypothetical protein